MPNLVKLFTIHGPMLIDTNELNQDRECLTIYTLQGNRKRDVASTEQERLLAGYGVHRDNLFASPELAHAASEKILQELFKRKK